MNMTKKRFKPKNIFCFERNNNFKVTNQMAMNIILLQYNFPTNKRGYNQKKKMLLRNEK